MKYVKQKAKNARREQRRKRKGERTDAQLHHEKLKIAMRQKLDELKDKLKAEYESKLIKYKKSTFLSDFKCFKALQSLGINAFSIRSEIYVT